MRNYLEFEKEIKSLEEDLDQSKNPFDKEGISEVDTNKIEKIQDEINEKLRSTYSKLNSWQRPKLLDTKTDPEQTFILIKYFQILLYFLVTDCLQMISQLLQALV